MNRLLVILLICITSFSFSQMSNIDKNVIKIRKLNVNPISEIISFSPFYEELDSVAMLENKLIAKQLYGVGKTNWFYDNDELFIFRNSLNRRMRRLATKKKTKFWKKVRRRKLKYNKLNLKSELRHSKYKEFKTKFRFKFSIDSLTGDTIQISKEDINSNVLIQRANEVILKLVVEEDTFEIDYNNLWKSIYNKKWENRELKAITRVISEEISMNNIMGNYSSSNKINGKRIVIQLNTEGKLRNKLNIIINNTSEEFQYKVLNDKLLIQSPNYNFMSEGKFNRRKTKLIFKDYENKKRYIFKLKK